ncbi:MAG: GNAT family N-acetyltransferase [Holosporales bacterium]|nr:GNAT family N-acetyltransferase [Holosporales bacterium]
MSILPILNLRILPILLQDVWRLEALSFSAFTSPYERPWSAQDFREFLLHLKGYGWICDYGFVLLQDCGDYTELAKLAVEPTWQRKGVASRLLNIGLSGTQRVVLEVAEDNCAARSLYEKYGFTQIGTRKGYYTRRREVVGAEGLATNAANASNAIVMARDKNTNNTIII